MNLRAGDLRRVGGRSERQMLSSAISDSMRRNMQMVMALLVTALAILPHAGCERADEEPVIALVQTVRTFSIEEHAPERVVRFSGVVEPAETADLAFAVDGTIESIDVDLGDLVERNEVLAVLDREPYELTVDVRRGQLEQARTALHQRERTYKRQRELFERGVISTRQYDEARAQYKTAREEIEVARQRLGLAERDLEKTSLTAPYEGVVAGQMAEEFEEVAAGRPILRLQVERGAEVAVLVPETLVHTIRVGDAVTVDVPAREMTDLPGRVIEIGRSSIAGNAFPVTIGLENEHDVWAGMTVEVALRFEHEMDVTGFLVPAAAVLAEGTGRAMLWLVDAENSTVHRAPVEIGTIHADRIEVRGGVQAGDLIVAAGVEFLRDGQQVRLQPNDQPGER